MDQWERLFRLMHRSHPDNLAYIYRTGRDGKLRTPYLAKLYPDDDMLTVLRDEYDGGDFRLLIREGRKLIYSGNISVVSGFQNRD